MKETSNRRPYDCVVAIMRRSLVMENIMLDLGRVSKETKSIEEEGFAENGVDPKPRL